ncbi:MAG: ribonucleoside reductase class II [Candidatus Thermoplasmatota archaeon]|nr:ribonucleoside reductase class II [Candidatus Thermoplasmatota archaeon]
MSEAGLTKNAENILEERYLKRDEEGNVVETPDEMFERVARTMAEVNEDYDDDRTMEKEKEEFYEALSSLDFIPNSPTLMNAGLELGQLSACFVLSPMDDMDSIFQQVKNAAKIFQSGGGVGYTFSRIRPCGDRVKSTGGVASGPVSFMKVYDEMCNTIKQGGKRRGAQMGVLSVQHPDIEKFIEAKDDEEELTNFNISVALTEEFMDAVHNGENYDLINPRNEEKEGELNAEEIYDKIVSQAWKNGEPGILFLDRVNEDNPFDVEEYPDHYIDATNPCVTGDTLISTKEGVFTAEELWENENDLDVVVDGRLSEEKIKEASNVFKTGTKDVFNLKTKEGYEIRLTEDHRVMSSNGWKKVKDLKAGEKLDIIDRETEFGEGGSLEKGLVLGWIVGDGQIKESENRVTLHFYDKDTTISDKYAEKVNQIIREPRGNGDYEVGVQKIDRGENSVEEERIRSARLYEITKEYGLNENKLQVPNALFKNGRETAKGFIRGLFTADGSVQGNVEKGVSVRLSSSELNLLKEVQQLLLGFGVKSKIYEERRKEGERELPDGKGNMKKYHVKSQHELVISKDNLKRFRDEIGFVRDDKNEKLAALLKEYEIGPYSEKSQVNVDSIEYEGHEDVYDLTEPETSSFVANGFVVHNCGEQPLEDFEACNLGHINLAHCVTDGEVDWDKLEDITDMAVRFLDNVIDASDFPNVIGYEGEEDAITKRVNENRKIGLGVMGWHHMLMKLGIPYDCEESIEKADEVMSFIQEKGREVSRRIAKKRGKFPNWNESEFDEPMRNATTTTIAPTGTTSMIANASGGIEPIFAVSYIKNVLEDESMVMPDQVFEEMAKDGGFYSDELMEDIAEVGSIADIEEVPKDIKPLFRTALEISPEWHIRMQAAFQDHVDNAISKTVNFPNEASKEDIKEVYDLAYDLKCKGVTVYRSGSRQEQVMEVEGEEKEEEEEEIEKVLERRPRERPSAIEGTTQKINTGYGGLYVTINEDEYGLFEVFSQIGRAGGFTQSFTESLARMISLCLRSGIPLEEIIEQLEGIRSPEIAYEEGEKILSIPDAMAKALKWHKKGRKTAEQKQLPTDENEGASSVKEMVSKGMNPACPDCGAMLTLTEGCRTCPNCGYSQC